MLVSSFNLLHSFNNTHYIFYKKRFKSEINSFCTVYGPSTPWGVIYNSVSVHHVFCGLFCPSGPISSVLTAIPAYFALLLLPFFNIDLWSN
jgi:hypothetical protein